MEARAIGRASKAKVTHQPADERVHLETVICTRIRSAVSVGELPPGTKLPEEAAAESFAASRAQIRAAFQRLAFEGLVDLRRNRGAFIACPSAKEAKDVFEARRVVERVTTEIVTRTITTNHLRALKAQVDESTANWFHASKLTAISGISSFHLALCRRAHNVALTTALERLIIRTSLILGLYATARSFVTLPVEYDRLVERVAAGRSLDAARQMERCLFVMEADLDFYQPPRQDVDVTRVLRMVGSTSAG